MNITLPLLLCFVLCCINIPFANSNVICNTPEGLPGLCIGIRQCPALLKLLNATQPVPQATKDYLKSCQCGSSKSRSNPSVCCPIEENVKFTSNPNLINSKRCGLSLADRIVGGVETVIGEFPWMAMLAYRNNKKNITQFRCGGMLINDRYVLTAAHCIDKNLVSVRLGEHNVDVEPDCDDDDVCAPTPQDILVNETIKHKDYSFTSNRIIHDIALIRLSQPALLDTMYVQPICLPVDGDDINLDGVSVTSAGWGRTENRSSSPVLLKVDVPVMPNNQCSEAFSKLKIFIGDNHLCAGGTNRTQDSCNGDSGGPLMGLNGNAKYVGYGVVSFGLARCGMEGIPGVYTRVGNYINWILQNVRE